MINGKLVKIERMEEQGKWILTLRVDETDNLPEEIGQVKKLRLGYVSLTQGFEK